MLLFVCLSLSCEYINLCNCERETNSRLSCLHTTCSCIKISKTMLDSSYVDVYVSLSVREVDVEGDLIVSIHAETQEQLVDMCNRGIDVKWIWLVG